MLWQKGAVAVVAQGLFYCCCASAQFADGPGVLALWHMETDAAYNSSRRKTLDDDSANPTRNRDLVMGGTDQDPSKPVLVPGGVYGKALSMDGVDDSCYVPSPYQVTGPYIAVDVSFKASQVLGKTQTLVSAGGDSTSNNSFELRINSDGRLGWYVWTPGGYASIQSRAAVSAGQWHTVRAALSTNALSLRVGGAAPVLQAHTGGLTAMNARPHVGCRQGTTAYRLFGGLIDEVRLVSNVPDEVFPPTGTVILFR